ncbi:ngep-related [Anaeramoeba flamelloides]|uniref:Ngep-related n=1 Tax=Anaeramoeba flamelloides TaxID=1746091 RepID=A0AAV7ZCU8_9EUKA|nr:ngep-related [Anaeramoeba flamelloides]
MSTSSSSSSSSGSSSGSENEIKIDKIQTGEQTNLVQEEGQTVYYEYVMVYLEEEVNEFTEGRKKKLFENLANVGLHTRTTKSATGDRNFMEIGTTNQVLEEWAFKTLLKVKKTSGVEDEDAGDYEEFNPDHKNLYVEAGDEGTIFNSCSRQKLLMRILEASKYKGGCGISITKLIRKKTIIDFFGLQHYEELDPLIEDWSKSWKFKQPLDRIRDYFGESIAYYFAFLAMYINFLIVLAIIGIPVAILTWPKKEESDISNQFKEQKGQVSLYYTFIVSMWITLLIELWKRRSNTLAYHWDMLDFHKIEQIRPEFKGIRQRSEITGKKQIYYPVWIRRVKMAISYFIVVCFMTAAAAAAIGINYKKLSTPNKEDYNPSMGTVIGLGAACGASIFVLNFIFKKIGPRLVDWENHKTDSEHEDSLILKFFMFQALNNYVALFFSAFISKDLEYVSTQLMSILITKQIIGQLLEVGIPWIKGKIKIRSAKKKRKKAKEAGEDVTKISQLEKESKLPKYESTVDDYLEMFIQLGFSTFFIIAFPLGPLSPLLALLNNLIEIRTDSLKLKTMRRPEPRGAKGIGKWIEVLKFVSVGVVISNCIMLSFADEIRIYGDTITTQENKLIWLICLEHGILFFKYIFHYIVPDIPKHVALSIAKEEYEKEKAHREALGRKSTTEESSTD